MLSRNLHLGCSKNIVYSYDQIFIHFTADTHSFDDTNEKQFSTQKQTQQNLAYELIVLSLSFDKVPSKSEFSAFYVSTRFSVIHES